MQAGATTTTGDTNYRVNLTEVSKWLAPSTDPAVLITSVAYGLLIALGVKAGLFGLWLLVLVLPSLWRYAYAVLRGAAQGRPELPPPGIDSMNPAGDWRAIEHFLLFAGLIGLIGQLGPGGTVPEFALTLVLALIFPASAAILALTANLVAALSPVSIVSVIKALGPDYLVLAGLCAGVAAAAELTRRLLAPQFGVLASLVGFIFAVWALLAEFGLIGASIRAHRDDFEIPGEWRSPAERDAKVRQKKWQAELDLAYAAIRSGEYEQGYETLRRLIAANGASVEIQYWLFENMIDWEDRTHAFRVAQRLIARLVEIGNLPAALELLQRCRRKGGELAIRPGTLRLLSRYAREIGQLGVASELDTLTGGADPE